MESEDQANSQAWSLWTKLARPALLCCPALGISVVMVVAMPSAALARSVPGSRQFTATEPTHRQARVLRSYEKYLAQIRSQAIEASRAVKFAYRQVGKPYQWGGAGPRAYDCSGLAMAAWRKGGLSLPHRADLQHRVIRRKVGLKHLRPGDLVFFSGDHHVGIYVGHRQFLHAPHTGTRVQRGSLTGWRLRAFAGAARPGAPAYHVWPQWVRTLAARVEGPSTGPAPRRHGGGHPMTGARSQTVPESAAPAEHVPAPSAGETDSWPDAAAATPSTSVTRTPPTWPVPDAGTVTSGPDAGTARLPATASPAVRPAAAEPAPPGGNHGPAAAGPGSGMVRPPAPATGARPAPWAAANGHVASRPGARPHWPRTSVSQTNDVLNRDFDSDSVSGSDDDGDDNDRTPIQTLLRPDEQLPGVLTG